MYVYTYAQSPNKKFFPPFGPQFGLKTRRGLVPRAPPLDPPLMYILQEGECTF